jgi:hypothetical protein
MVAAERSAVQAAATELAAVSERAAAEFPARVAAAAAAEKAAAAERAAAEVEAAAEEENEEQEEQQEQEEQDTEMTVAEQWILWQEQELVLEDDEEEEEEQELKLEDDEQEQEQAQAAAEQAAAAERTAAFAMKNDDLMMSSRDDWRARPPMMKSDDDAGLAQPMRGSRTVRLWTGSRFPVQTRSKEPFARNLRRFLKATAQKRGVVDVVSPSCFTLLNSTAASPGLQMQPGCEQRVRGLHAQGFRVEPMISGSGDSTIGAVRLRLRDPAFVRACADAMSALNASGLVFDLELERSNKTDGHMFAAMLTAVRAELRRRVPTAVVSVATGTGAMGKTDVLASSSADEFISMGTYWQLSSFQSGILRDVQAVGRGRYSCGLCDSCAAQVGDGNNSVDAIDQRFKILAATHVENLAWWLLEYDSPGSPLPTTFKHEYWWAKIREWKADGPFGPAAAKSDDDGSHAYGGWWSPGFHSQKHP